MLVLPKMPSSFTPLCSAESRPLERPVVLANICDIITCGSTPFIRNAPRSRCSGLPLCPLLTSVSLSLYERQGSFAEVAVQQLRRVGAEPSVDHLRVHRPEVGFHADVARCVLERWVARIGVQAGGRAVKAAVHA